MIVDLVAGGAFLSGIGVGFLFWRILSPGRFESKPMRVGLHADDPYRTAEPRSDAPLPREWTALDDMQRAIDDGIARANDELRKGKITPYQYGERLDDLKLAAVKAAQFRDAVNR